MTISGLVRKGTLTVASLPPENWRGVADTPSLTVPLIAEDYSAKTALMWNAAYAAFGMADKNSMMLADPKDTADILAVFRQDPAYRGGGAGIGFKEAVIPYLDETTPIAAVMGAVNIIKKMPDGRLVGGNTDGAGFVASLEDVLAKQKCGLSGARVLVLGAGGTGRAIAFALAERGAHLVILNRTEAKAVELAGAINGYVGKKVAEGGGRESIAETLPRMNAVVSTVDDAHSPLDEYAPLGPMPTPVNLELVRHNLEETHKLLEIAPKGLVVSDIRIRSRVTPMLKVAQSLGLPTLDGIPMVVNQGIEAFWWLYEEALSTQGLTRADVAEVMRRAVKS